MQRICIRQVAILGAGTMGAQLAAICANAGCSVLLFDLKQEKTSLAEQACARLRTMKPEPLTTAHSLTRISACNYTDHLQRISECDWVIEAVAESMDIKQQLYQQICPLLAPHALLTTNTSGLSIQTLADALPQTVRPRFFGTHFFNPPRYLPLVECIFNKETVREHADQLTNFITDRLGKDVIMAPDSPNFIANRVGLFSLLLSAHNAVRLNIPLEVVDILTGPYLMRPKSATFRTADVVGLDILANATKTAWDMQDDPWHDLYQLPDFMKTLVENGDLGQKSGRGVYHKTDQGIHVYDCELNSYRPKSKKPPFLLKRKLKQHDFAQLFEKCSASNERHHQFLWQTMAELWLYCAWLAEHLSLNVAEIDRAIMRGFGWEMGPFAMWQEAGKEAITSRIQKCIEAGDFHTNITLPTWVVNAQAFYLEGDSFDPQRRAYVKTQYCEAAQKHYRCQRAYTETNQSEHTHYTSSASRIWSPGNSVIVMTINTPMGTIGQQVIDDLQRAIDLAETHQQPLIIWPGPHEHFGVGANLKEVATQYALRGIRAIDHIVNDFQQVNMRLKYCSIPTIATVKGFALGGSCEVMLHCDYRIACENSYIGLVEVGVGIIPGAGGCKEMAIRALQHDRAEDTHFEHFKTLAMGEVATSATAARDKGFLTHADTIIAHPDALLSSAIAYGDFLTQRGYIPPSASITAVPGTRGISNCNMAITNLQAGEFASTHDATIARALAEVMCGGAVTPGSTITEQQWLDLERAAFLRLVACKPSQARMKHMLKTGKRLAN